MKSLRFTLSLVLVLFGSFFSFSAPPPPSTGTPTCWPPPCIPVDGGVSLLVAAGALYGAKKIYNKRTLKASE